MRKSSSTVRANANRLARDALREAFHVLTPPPKMTISEWADDRRFLSPESSAEPGKWNTGRLEYLRGIMDAVGDPSIHTVVIKTASQVGKTSALENVLGYHIDLDPAPILLVVPTLELADAYSKDRLKPMIRDCPVLLAKVGDPDLRNHDNRLRHKIFPGGHLTLAGANSPASLSARPIRIVLGDEIDRWPVSAGDEGDPLKLAAKRTEAFWNRRKVWCSTPTRKGFSRIEREYEASDQRRFWVPCGHCGDYQLLMWASVRWESKQPKTAVYVCEACGTVWDERDRRLAIELGEWRAEKETNGVAGFWLNGLYSPWTVLPEKVQEFLDAKGKPSLLQVFTNTFLAEEWEEDAERINAHGLAERVTKEYEDGGVAPSGVYVVTAGVDVQDDRLEIERVGWGRGEESWSLDYTILYGDPSTSMLWKDLDELLTTNTVTQDGRQIPVNATCIDTGGHHTQAVYRYVKRRVNRKVYGIKGASKRGLAVWPKRASKTNIGKIELWLIGVDAAKDEVYGRLKIDEPGEGFCHFPAGRDSEYFKQLTAERVETRYERGTPYRVYVKDPSVRNEALDCRVYAYAALEALNVRWGRLLAAVHAVSPELRSDQDDEPPPSPRRRRSRIVKSSVVI